MFAKIKSRMQLTYIRKLFEVPEENESSTENPIAEFPLKKHWLYVESFNSSMLTNGSELL